MTPIERYVWDELQRIGLPFLPQYPVGKFFVDFADPVQKIIIECDGREFHEKERDAKRDEILGADGWLVFRLPGDACFRIKDSPCVTLYPDQIDDLRPGEDFYEWMTSTAEGFCCALRHVFYSRNGVDEDRDNRSTFDKDAISALRFRCGMEVSHG